MAVVYRARDLHLDRPVAVKRLTPAALDDPTALERFQREAQAIARLADPHIVTVHDFGFDDEAPYLVMELVEGPSLAAVLMDGPLPVVRAVEIARQASRALAAAHAAGVIHRDVKPANLLLAPDGVVKMCDFGIAHLQNIPTLSPPPDAGAALGTANYMAPETIRGGPVDARTDLYAVGCVLHAMLTGHPPFLGDNPVGVAVQHLHDPPPPLGPPVPADLAALVAQLLAKNPAERPGRADEVEQRLSALSTVSGAPAGTVAITSEVVRDAAPPTASLPTARLPAPAAGPRHLAAPWTARRWVRAAAGVIAVLIVVAGVWLVGRSNSGGSPTDAGRSAAAPASQPATASPGVTPSTPPPSSRPPAARTSAPPPRPAALITTARAALTTLVRRGDLDPESAREVDKRLEETADAISSGKDDKAWNKLREAAEKVAKLRDEGKLTSAGYEVLAAALGQIAQGLERN